MRRRFFQNTNNVSYMFIEALENDFSLSITYIGKLQYCIDNGEYKDVGTSISGVNKGSRIYFVGYLQYSSGLINHFNATKKCKIGGDIRSIMYGNDFKKYCNIVDNRFRGLFRESTGIVGVENGLLEGLTTLAEHCYDNMFYGCTSLVNAPKLPATTLARSCYYSMFYGCTSLVDAPQLPATILTERCYSRMFYGCTNLNYIKMIATDISATDCLLNWVEGVSSTGTFVKNKDATWDVRGESGIPSNWKIEYDHNYDIGSDISFHIERIDETLYAKDWMTWDDWVHSKYNTVSARISGNEILIPSYSSYPLDTYPDNIIKNGGTYYFKNTGGGSSD